MAVYQLLTAFTDNAGGGASEQFFVNVNETGKVALQALLSQYANVRLTLLSNVYSITEMRISDVTIFRDSYILESLTGTQLRGRVTKALAGGDPEEIFTRLLIRMESGALHRRPYELVGIPGSVLTAQRQYTPSILWSAVFGAWKEWILGNAYMKFRGAITNGPAVDQILSYAVTNDNPGGLRITIAGSHAADYPDNSLLRISRAKYSLNVNGNWRVLHSTYDAVNDRTTTDLAAKRYPPVFTNVTVLGKVIRIRQNNIGLDYDRITAVIPERGVRRKSGRPFDQERGRQSHQG